MGLLVMLMSVGYFALLLLFLRTLLFSPSPPRRLLALVALFLNYAFLLLTLRLEYLAFLLVILYVGAIAVLFLFVIMLVSVNRARPSRDAFSLGLGAGVLVFFTLVVLSLFGVGLGNVVEMPSITGGVFSSSPLSLMGDFGYPLVGLEMDLLGLVLWTHAPLLVISSALVIVVAVVGSITLTRLLYRRRTVRFYLRSLDLVPFSLSSVLSMPHNVHGGRVR